MHGHSRAAETRRHFCHNYYCLLYFSCGQPLERNVSPHLISWFAQLCVSSMWAETPNYIQESQSAADNTSQGPWSTLNIGQAVTESTSNHDRESLGNQDASHCEREVLAKCDHRPNCDGALLSHCLRLSYRIMRTSPDILAAVVYLLSKMIVSSNLAGTINILLFRMTRLFLHTIITLPC
ncbi:hypothetical protein SPONL_1938 [uncultured Candidatus Thioglobus sp.]|nr:hypothetical protein SPONL_1938 [uncultured Candidatus Thioglobus sp.]